MTSTTKFLTLLLALFVSFVLSSNQVANAATAPAASKQVFSRLFAGYTTVVAHMDPAQNLYVAGNPTDFSLNTFRVFKVSPTGSFLFRRDIVRPTNTVNTSPSSIETIGNNLLVLVNGGYSNGGMESNVFILDATTGAQTGLVKLKGPDFIENGQTSSVIVGVKLIRSSVAGKVYVIASALMDISRAAYGYSVARIDIASRTVDWQTNYLKAGTDGGSVETGLELNSFLLVGGQSGAYRYNINTGVRSDIPALTGPIFSFAPVSGGFVLASEFNRVISINRTSLAVRWTSTGVGMVQPGGTGPDATSVWFARTLASSGNPSDWNVEAGVIATESGQVLWRRTFDSGSGLLDSFVGGLSGQYGQGSALRALQHGQTRTGFIFKRTVDVVRLLTFDHSTRTVSSSVTDSTIGIPGLFAFAGTISWGITFDGNAIRFTHAAPSGSTALQIGDDSGEVDESQDNTVGIAVGVSVGFLALAAALVVIKKRRNSVRATAERHKSIVATPGTTLMSSNPMFGRADDATDPLPKKAIEV